MTILVTGSANNGGIGYGCLSLCVAFMCIAGRTADKP